MLASLYDREIKVFCLGFKNARIPKQAKWTRLHKLCLSKIQFRDNIAKILDFEKSLWSMVLFKFLYTTLWNICLHQPFSLIKKHVHYSTVRAMLHIWPLLKTCKHKCIVSSSDWVWKYWTKLVYLLSVIQGNWIKTPHTKTV